MIRPLATAISISASDVSQYMKHIDIYQGLLKQGFKKKDVQRYFREQRAAVLRQDSRLEHLSAEQAPSNVELSGQNIRIADSHSSRASAASAILHSDSATNVFDAVDKSEINSECYNGQARPIREPQRQNASALVEHRTAPVRYGADQQNYDQISCNHAPRRSSLLRFSSNVSSDEHNPLDQSAARVSVAYSHRPCQESCVRQSPPQQLTDSNDSTPSSLVTVFESLILDESLVPATMVAPKRSFLRGDAKEFEPSNQNFDSDNDMIAAREDSGRSPSVAAYFTPAPTLESNARIIPSLRSRNSGNFFSYLHRQPASSVNPSSPSMSRREALLGSSPNSSGQSDAPESRPQRTGTRTAPRSTRPQYLDGPSFTPYDDSMPAHLQPQTPADLARRPLYDERSAAYTAPPGRIRDSFSATRSERRLDFEPGEESPTNRAMSVRQRRNAEYSRSARVEGLRISRIRQRAQRSRGGGQGQAVELEDRWDLDEQLNLWRDDLDADRVGEENFEDVDRVVDIPVTRMRTVSGNRRAQL